MRKGWTTEEDNKILFKKKSDESWKDFTSRELPHRTHEAVRLHAVRYLGVNNKTYTHRTYSFDKDVWKTQTPESCYWAGFIAADGCLIEYNGGTSLCIDLQKRDSSHLEKFAKFCEYNGGLQKERKRGNSITQSIRINLGKDFWIDDLKDHYNITSRKTYSLEPPNIEGDYLLWCYIIGFIDGDGCIHLNSRKSLQFQVVGASYEFICWLQWMFSDLAKNSYLRKNKRIVSKQSKYYNAGLYGLPACAVIDYLSSFPVPKLERKWTDSSVINHIQEQKEKYPDKFIKKQYN